jgi:phenylalanyl-tRNA synthetase alpha chain
MNEIDKIKKEFNEEIRNANVTFIKDLENKYLGRKGLITNLFQEMKSLPDDTRRKLGQDVNELKANIEKEIEMRIKEINNAESLKELEGEKVDITLPGVRFSTGALHIITQTIREVEDIFISMGFDVMTGPEVESDYYNFEALNIPEYHPARDMQDTFYLAPKLLLRTQTSPIQIRIMEAQKPQIRMVASGRCYRRDAADSSHFPIFHQVEGLVVDKKISFRNLKGVLSEFTRRMFGDDIKVRFSPSYFPFVEPGAETAISCVMCGGKGCPVCKYSGWLEMGGSGMVHPNVLRNVGIDPEEYQGFAFGWGIERIAMVKYEIPDIRMFYQNDLRFLNQFK